MNSSPPINLDLMRRYERLGLYQYLYPDVSQFSEKFEESDLIDVIRRSNEEPIPRSLSFSVSLPSDLELSGTLICNKRQSEKYLQALNKEVAMLAPLFERDRAVTQFYWRGGTANFMSSSQIGEFMEYFLQHFHFSTSISCDVSIEIDPRFFKAEEISALAMIGFNRVVLGVINSDPATSAAANSIQSLEQSLNILKACRDYNFKSVNIDFIYGLPEQTPQGLSDTLDGLIAARPDRIAVCRNEHKNYSADEVLSAGDELFRTKETDLSFSQVAIDKLLQAGYCHIGMNYFALPEDELTLAQSCFKLHRDLMGYTTHGDNDFVGCGVSAISHVGDGYSQDSPDVKTWEAIIETGHLPVWRGVYTNEDDVIRSDLIERLMCQGEIDIQKFEEHHNIYFHEYFLAELEKLQSMVGGGLLEISPIRLKISSSGRFFLSRIASSFADAVPPFSKIL